MSTRNQEINQQWELIQDLIVPTYDWPYYTRRLFWIKPLGHFQRALIAAFGYINGLNPVILIEWLQLMNLSFPAHHVRHISALYNLYAWNTSQRQYQYLDGRVRIYQPAYLRKN
jgi:hypothetical protein